MQSNTLTVLYLAFRMLYYAHALLEYKKYISNWFTIVFPYYPPLDWNYYFGLGPILKPKPNLADAFSRYSNQYHNQYQNHISKETSRLNYYFGLGPILKPKPKLADAFRRYSNQYHIQYQNHISKGKSCYQWYHWKLLWSPATLPWVVTDCRTILRATDWTCMTHSVGRRVKAVVWNTAGVGARTAVPWDGNLERCL